MAGSFLSFLIVAVLLFLLLAWAKKAWKEAERDEIMEEVEDRIEDAEIVSEQADMIRDYNQDHRLQRKQDKKVVDKFMKED